MPVQIKRFNAILDTDLSETEVDFFSVLDALNVVYRGEANNRRVQNIIGNSLISNSALPAGNNECIGAFYDQVSQRIIWFNWNSNGNHAIFIYNTVPKTIQTLLINGSATQGDILGFTLNNPILSIVIVYQEDIQGDLLVYLDSQGRPTCINILFFLNTPYAVTKRSFIDLAKAPPRCPVRCCYGNDPSTNLNNLQNALFKFRTRYVYRDYMKPVYSVGSRVSLPNETFNQDIYSDQTSNNFIYTFFSTGDEDVIKIELWVQQATDNVENSNWLLVESFDKAMLAIPDNSIYQFDFYNDGVYVSADPAQIVQLFDFCPIAAQCLELLNGNTIIMGNITEGYNQTPINMTLTSNLNYIPPVNDINGLLFFASQSGLDSYGNVGDNITIYLFGTNDGAGNIPGNGLNYTVTYGVAGTNNSFQYSSGSNTSIATILDGILAAAEVKGFTLVGSVGANSFTVSLTNVSLYYAQTTNSTTGGSSPYTESVYSFVDRCAYQLAVCYYDQKGRTIGAQFPSNNGITTLNDLSGNLTPQIIATINNQPPLYAYYYSIVRSLNLTYDKYLMWICNQTFVNTDLATGYQYAYIGYSNMELYNENVTTANPGGTPVVGYTFSQGDRIRFLINYPLNGSSVQMSPANDYQIVSVETDPVLNGIIQEGSFIKIIYPTTDISASFNFGFASGLTPLQSDNFQRYKILIYNYAKRVTEDQEVFYDFGRQYAIGNPGTNTAFHIGSDQSQSIDYTTPAIIRMSDGDFFYRERQVPTGLSYYINAQQCAFSQHSQTFTTQATENPQGVVNPTAGSAPYQINQQLQNGVGFGPGNYPQYSPTNADRALYWNETSSPQNIRLRGTIPLNATTSCTVFGALYFMNAANIPPTQFQYLFQNFNLTEEATVQGYEVVVDVIITIPANTQAWLFYGFLPGIDTNFTGQVGGFTLRLDVLNYITIPVMDSSFDDAYNIVYNANLRPLPYDDNAQQNTFETLLRWSLSDQFGTEINQLNRFYDQNQDEVDRAKGPLLRLKSRDRILRGFQARGCFEKGVYNSFINQASGENVLTTTNAIITIGNTPYYEGEFGLGNHPESLVSGKIQDYFFDPVRGYMVRLSQDGLIPVSELYKGQYYIRSLITPYLSNWTKADGSNARIIGCYNFFEEEWIGILQAGTNGAQTIQNYAIAFNEKNNAYGSKYSFNEAEWIISAEEDFYTFLNGQLYFHDNNPNTNTAPYCNYFGVQYPCYVKTVFNQNLIEKKTFISIAELASQIWEAPLIYTNQYTYGTTRQQSKLIPANFATLEGLFETSFMRDINSPGGWINGYTMKGSYLGIQLQVTNPTGLVWISEVKLKYITSPLNAS
jgi:hypothetical protein